MKSIAFLYEKIISDYTFYGREKKQNIRFRKLKYPPEGREKLGCFLCFTRKTYRPKGGIFLKVFLGPRMGTQGSPTGTLAKIGILRGHRGCGATRRKKSEEFPCAFGANMQLIPRNKTGDVTEFVEITGVRLISGSEKSQP